MNPLSQLRVPCASGFFLRDGAREGQSANYLAIHWITA